METLTEYAESLVKYAMWYGSFGREDAIKFLDGNAGVNWRTRAEQPSAGVVVITEIED